MLQKLHQPDLGLLFIRVMLGIVFSWHGYMKLTGLEGTIGYFSTLGFPALVAYLVTITELVGGILLILGFFVPFVSLLLATVMAGAIFATDSNGAPILFGHEYEIVLLFVLAGLAMFGNGSLSVQSMLKKSSTPLDM